VTPLFFFVLLLLLFFYQLKHEDFMLPCVCSVIDHRRRGNIVRTSLKHSVIAKYATFLFNRILSSSVICYWTDACNSMENSRNSCRKKLKTSISGLLIKHIRAVFTWVTATLHDWLEKTRATFSSIRGKRPRTHTFPQRIASATGIYFKVWFSLDYLRPLW